MTLTVWQFALAIGLPSAFTGGLVGLFFWRLQRKIEKRDAEAAAEAARREEREAQREEAREKNELNTIRAIGASIALGEATARAVQRIPDAHCNGDMHAALDYAQRVKHELKDFLTEQGIQAIYADPPVARKKSKK